MIPEGPRSNSLPGHVHQRTNQALNCKQPFPSARLFMRLQLRRVSVSQQVLLGIWKNTNLCLSICPLATTDSSFQKISYVFKVTLAGRSYYGGVGFNWKREATL